MGKSRIAEDDRNSISRGNLLVAAVEVKPGECISYVESYLQAVACLADGCLPSGNDQIG